MARKRVVFPTCAKCDAEINPHKYDDCEKYYIVEDEVYCKYCYMDWLKDYVESNPDELADLLCVPVVEVE